MTQKPTYIWHRSENKVKLTCFGDIISIDKHTRFVNERNGSPSHKITGSIADESREKWPKTHLTLALQIRQQYTNLTAKVIEQFHSKGAIQGRRLIDRNFHVMRTVNFHVSWLHLFRRDQRSMCWFLLQYKNCNQLFGCKNR